MRMPSSPFAIALVLVCLVAFDARAQEEATEATEGTEETEGTEGEGQKEIKVGGEAAVDSVGGATGFVFKQGFYTQSDLGGFFRFGGFTNEVALSDGSPGCGRNCKPVAVSQLQPFIGLSAGYDIFTWLGIQLSFGTGFVANAAAIGNGAPDNPRDYGMTFINIGVVGSYYVLDRLAISGRVFGGGAFLTPTPAPDIGGAGGNFGGGLGIRYATLLTDVFVGFDVNFLASISPGGSAGVLIIPGMSFAPVLKYVF